MRKLLNTLFAILLVTISISCSKEPTFTGSIEVSFASNTYTDWESTKLVEGSKIALFPTDFDDSFAWDYDAIEIEVVVNNSCRFDNILMGTYKIGFFDEPRIFETIQVIPNKTTSVIFFD